MSNTPTLNEQYATRRAFKALVEQAYPNTSDPAWCWVLSEVLGWDYSKLETIVLGTASEDGYSTFVLDENGKKEIEPTGFNAVKVRRKWTPEEKRKLNDWFWLING